MMCAGGQRYGCEWDRMPSPASKEYEPYQSPPPGTNVITLKLLTSRVIRDITGMHLLSYIRGLCGDSLCVAIL